MCCELLFSRGCSHIHPDIVSQLLSLSHNKNWSPCVMELCPWNATTICHSAWSMRGHLLLGIVMHI
uniref:Uncharacterized protein n=1 Tax=Arundo donax TaxID=35708 RepID=A0A0A9CW05_ARUDO